MMPGRSKGKDSITPMARTDQPPPVRFALIGAGGVAKIHAPSLAASPDVDVRWVVDLDTGLAETLAGQVGGRVTAEMDEALSDPEVDAVLVALPTAVHRMATERAAAAGKHVFCEKPIARTVEDARAMTEACERAGVVFQVGHVVRFFPEYMKIKELLDAGTLGQVAMVRTQRRSGPVMETRPWFADIEKSGGLIIDLMIHDLDTLRWYFGDAERLYAHGLSYTEWQKRRDVAMASVRFRNGVIAHLDASWSHGAFYTAIEVAGEKGLVRHDSRKNATITFEHGAQSDDGSTRLAFARPASLSPYGREMAHFVDAIRTGAPVLTDGEEATRSLTMAQAVLDSMREERPIVFQADPADAVAV